MKQFFYENDKNVCALKGVTDDSVSRHGYFKIIGYFLSRVERCVIFARRNNYDVKYLLQQIKIESLVSEIEYFENSEDQFEVFLSFRRGLQKESLISLLVEIWFAYEQPVFCFFNSDREGVLIDEEYFRSLVNLSWKQILGNHSGFVFFRSAEEDVVWIGKSEGQIYSFLCCQNYDFRDRWRKRVGNWWSGVACRTFDFCCSMVDI